MILAFRCHNVDFPPHIFMQFFCDIPPKNLYEIHYFDLYHLRCSGEKKKYWKLTLLLSRKYTILQKQVDLLLWQQLILCDISCGEEKIKIKIGMESRLRFPECIMKNIYACMRWILHSLQTQEYAWKQIYLINASK